MISLLSPLIYYGLWIQSRKQRRNVTMCPQLQVLCLLVALWLAILLSTVCFITMGGLEALTIILLLAALCFLSWHCVFAIELCLIE